jgi:hypothetical protein
MITSLGDRGVVRLVAQAATVVPVTSASRIAPAPSGLPRSWREAAGVCACREAGQVMAYETGLRSSG